MPSEEFRVNFTWHIVRVKTPKTIATLDPIQSSFEYIYIGLYRNIQMYSPPKYITHQGRQGSASITNLVHETWHQSHLGAWWKTWRSKVPDSVVDYPFFESVFYNQGYQLQNSLGWSKKKPQAPNSLTDASFKRVDRTQPTTSGNSNSSAARVCELEHGHLVRWFTHLKNAMFNSYVSLPEYIRIWQTMNSMDWSWLDMTTAPAFKHADLRGVPGPLNFRKTILHYLRIRPSIWFTEMKGKHSNEWSLVITGRSCSGVVNFGSQ